MPQPGSDNRILQPHRQPLPFEGVPMERVSLASPDARRTPAAENIAGRCRHGSGSATIRPIESRRHPMANKEQRSNREKRKPKKEKPKPGPHISTYSGTIIK